MTDAYGFVILNTKRRHFERIAF